MIWITRVMLFGLLLGAVAIAGVYEYEDYDNTTVVSVADTNVASGTVALRALTDGQRHQTKYNGLMLELWSSDMHCDSIADVGSEDTVVVNVYTKNFWKKHSLLYDTLAGVPCTTSFFVDGVDTNLAIYDQLYMDYTMWDTNTTVRDSSGVVTCTLLTNMRFWKE